MGCGTGILSYYACMAGARRVYAVEQGPIIAAAKLICKQNGFLDRVTLINDWSDKIDIPEKVDVIITETVGNLAFEERILGWIIDAKKRYIEKGGQIIPRTLELVIVPVECAEFDDYIDIWK
jgi:predicted RNA methylase